MMTKEIAKEQINSLRELAETLTGKKFGNIKDPVKLQAIIDYARAENLDVVGEAKSVSPSNALISKAEKRAEARKEATKLVRCNITAMGPFEKQLQGAMFDVGNSVVGAIRRYIPFDTDWHCEAMLLEHIKQRKYRTKHEWKDPDTQQPVYENRFHKAFGVVVLDTLSKDELEKHTLAMKSRAYGSNQ